MQASPLTTQPEASRAFTIILERLYAMARQTDASLGNPSDLEATLIALPSENRSQVMLVLESVESRAWICFSLVESGFVAIRPAFRTEPD
jgi:hypothetical protein